MASTTQAQALRALGQLIRVRRVSAGLTQAALGRKAGIVGKYVSEIERGNRDIPFSTLRRVVEDGLGLSLDVRFEAKGAHRASPLPPIPPELREVAELPAESRKAVLAVIRGLLALVRD
ncbi:MAG: helix-turn-helix domain-containing protein [Kofleriaceae bacterium]